MPAETTTAICSMIMGGIFEKFPKLKVCFAHGGKQYNLSLIEQSITVFSGTADNGVTTLSLPLTEYYYTVRISAR